MADLIKVSILGSMPGSEVWSVNPVFALTTGSVVSTPECAAIAAAVNAVTVPTGLRNVMTANTQVIGARAEARTVGGTLEAIAEANRVTPVFGSGGSALPYQSALVATLQTLTAGGRGRGRLYWPATGASLDLTTLRLDSSLHSGFLSAMVTYLTAVEAAVDGAIDETVSLAVWSRTANALPQVTSIRVGNIIDTQRRRRDALSETYLSSAF